MSAAALQGIAHVREAETSAARDPFAPESPMVWWYGRLRYADESGAPVHLRFRERVRKLWYDLFKSPPVGEKGTPVFPDFRGFYATRAEARVWCAEGDAQAFVVSFPFGQKPFGDEVFDIPTFCRPFHGAGRSRDPADAERYARVNLRAHVCAELYAECERQRVELEKFWGLVSPASRLTRTCDEV